MEKLVALKKAAQDESNGQPGIISAIGALIFWVGIAALIASNVDCSPKGYAQERAAEGWR